ncbi:MAG: ATP-binding protein [Bacteroidota bacterium]
MRLINKVLLISLLLFPACKNQVEDYPLAKKGFIDLSKWDFDQKGLIALNGEWEFYWKKLLVPDSIKTKISNVEYIHVPQGWASGMNASKKYPQFGYATYKLKVKLANTNNNLKLKFSQINSAAKVWINDSLVLTQGKPGAKDNFEPEYIEYRNYIDQQKQFANSDTLEIVIQVADFFFGGTYAGLYKKIKIGKAEQIHQLANHKIFYYSFLAGIMFVLAINYFVFFFFHKKDYSRLVFALLSIAVLIRVLAMGDFLIPYLNMDLMARLYYVSIPFYAPLMTIFFYTNYKDESNKLLTIIISVIGLIFLSFYLFFPVHNFVRMDFVLFAFIILTTIYLIFFVVLKALVNKRQGSLFALLGTVILLILICYDILATQSYVENAWFLRMSTGFVLFQLFQAASLAQNFSWAFKQNILLSNELKFQNLNLEQIVNKRTETIELQKNEIVEKNAKLTSINEEVICQNEEISQQNEEIKTINIKLDEYKNNLEKKIVEQTKDLIRAKENAERADLLKTAFLENLSHEIRTPLNAIVGFSNLLENLGNLSDTEKDFVMHINFGSKSLLKIVDSIMQVSKIQLGEYKISLTEFNITKLIHELFEEFKASDEYRKKKKLELKLNLKGLPEHKLMNSDISGVRIVFFNLIENAIKYTESGLVEIGVLLKNENIIHFYVKDTGIGIGKGDIKFIFEKFRKIEPGKTKLYRGLGLGLTIAKSMVEQLGGRIWLESEAGKGSTFYFIIPNMSS